jgi:hypothetical protein
MPHSNVELSDCISITISGYDDDDDNDNVDDEDIDVDYDDDDEDEEYDEKLLLQWNLCTEYPELVL